MTDGSQVVSAPTTGPGPRGRGWTVLSVCLIVIGCLLAPLAVVTAWGKATLVDTDQFVATYAPLATNRDVQDYVIDRTMSVIDAKVDTDRISDELIQGIEDLGTNARTNSALEALRGPISQGLRNLMKTGVTDFVRSDAFPAAWKKALRISHDQMTATMRNDPDAVLQAQDNGAIGIQLGPIVERIKQHLIDRGVDVAKRIPAVHKTVPIADASDLGAAQVVYRTVVALGTWLLWLCLAFLVAGVVVARRRLTALLGASIGVALVMLLLKLGFVVGLNALTATLPPSAPTDLLFDTATDQMRDTATAALVLGIGVAIVTWISGPFTSTAALRGAYSSAAGSARNHLRGAGFDAGKVGDVLYAQRVPIRIAIALAVAAVIILSRPLSVDVVVTTGVVALIVLAIVSILQQPAGRSRTDDTASDAATPATTGHAGHDVRS